MDNKVAVLIDAENTSVRYIEDVLKELKQYGELSVQRMYGDFSSNAMGEWAKKGLEFAIVPIHQARYTATKNASDIMLVIDAMDILYQGSADIFCIVSSDSDFTRLASRLREGGKKVIGMGKSNASKSFITACNEYKFLDKISEEDEDSFEEPAAGESAVTSITLIKQALNHMMQFADSTGEPLNMGSAKSQLQRQFADFDERNYGYTLFRKFVEEETNFRVDIQGSTAYVVRKKQMENNGVLDQVTAYIVNRARTKIVMSTLGNELRNRYPNFKYKEQGYSTFSKFIMSIPQVKITVKDGKQLVEEA